MSSNFDEAIKVVLSHEGGWCDTEGDLGGETNWGISTLIIKRANITAEELGIEPSTMFQKGYLKPMKVEAAKAVYKRLFWDPGQYAMIDDQTCATKVFDFAINAGPGNSAKVAQRAANDCGHQLVVDGDLGPKSFAAINACGPAFVGTMAYEMGKYYRAVVANRPASAKFLKNWLKRAAWGI